MKHLICFFLIFFSSFGFSQDCPFCSSLELNVSGLRNNNGILRVMLTSNEAAFNESDAKKIDVQKLYLRNEEIKDGKATVYFPKLQSGEYAYKVFHDENNNEILDSTLMGKPVEGVSVSGYQQIGRDRVLFSKAKFRILARKKYKLPVQVKYLEKLR